MMHDPLHEAQVWLDSCRKFVITCEQQLEQAKWQEQKAEERVKQLTDETSMNEDLRFALRTHD